MTNESSALSLFLKDLYRVKPLSIEQEVALAARIKNGDYLATCTLVTHNLRFVVSVVKKMTLVQYGKIDLEDLIAAGYEGMMKAATKWEPQDGIKFVGFARPFIERSVVRCIENTANIIRLPVNIGEDIRRMKYTERDMTQKLNRHPTLEEIATKMGVQPKRVHQLRNYMLREPESIDAINDNQIEGEEE